MAKLNYTAAMFNEIRNDPASGLSLLPEATLNNINTIKTILDSDPEAYNKYVTAMLVRIGRVYIETPKFGNPLARFNRGLNPMGHLVQNIYIEPIYAEGNFNPQGPNPLGRRTLDNVHVEYVQVNYQPYFAISVDRVGMMNAFASWDQLDRFWGAQMRAMYTGADISEYNAELHVINSKIAETGTNALPVADMGNIIAKDEASGKAFVQALKYIINDLKFPNEQNAAGVTQVVRPEDLVLLLNKDIEPNLDVYTLASLFHAELVDIPTRIVAIDSFAADAAGETNQDVLGLLTTREFFQFYTTLSTVRTIENPQGLFVNHFFHPWMSIQTSNFAPAIVLKSSQPAPEPEPENPDEPSEGN